MLESRLENLSTFRRTRGRLGAQFGYGDLFARYCRCCREWTAAGRCSDECHQGLTGQRSGDTRHHRAIGGSNVSSAPL